MRHEDMLPGSERGAARIEPTSFSLCVLTAACSLPAYSPVFQ